MPNAYERRRIAELAEGSARAANLTDCARCGQPVLTGDDDDRVAMRVRADTDVLDPVTEMLAILDGRATFDLERMRGKTARHGAHALYHRDEFRIHGNRPPRGTVHAEHRCDPAHIESHRHAQRQPDDPMPALW